jgi:hypothetical protein
MAAAAVWCNDGMEGLLRSCGIVVPTVYMEHTTIAVDLAKSVLQVVISQRAGRVDIEKRLTRDASSPWFEPAGV